MSQDSDVLTRLAERVVDGAEVNWASEMDETPRLSGQMSALETLVRIRAAHAGTIPGTTETAEAPMTNRDGLTEGPRPLFTWGKLEVLEWMGEGSFGEVYRAYDPALQTELALKLRKEIRPGEDPKADLFLDEARRLARVRHPHVLVVYGVDTHDRRTGIWTEFLHGQTLEKFLEDRGPMNAPEAASIGLDLCKALAAVHAAQLIHRDVKTTNVMRETGGRIVLMDFGSGGALPPAGDVRTTTHIHGTPIAMAPEQFAGIVAGPPTDIYGLGVLLYRLVTRSFPVEAGTLQELKARHARGERTPLRDHRSDLPLDFVQVVERAIESRPEDRFQSAGEMELALAKTLDGRSRDEEGPGGWKKALVAAGALAALAGVIWMVSHLPKPIPVPAPSPRPLTASAELYRHSDSGDERLTPGARIAPADRLYMTLSGSDSMYAYVVDEDLEGKIFALFPNPALSPANPLAPGEHRLPDHQGDSVANWEVTTGGGKETITVIASRRPIPEIENVINSLPRPSVHTPVQYAEVSRSAFRGIGGIKLEATKTTQAEPSIRVSDALRKLAGQHEADSPWIWQEELESPRALP